MADSTLIRVSAVIAPDLKERIARLAARQMCPEAVIVRQCIQKALAELERKAFDEEAA